MRRALLLSLVLASPGCADRLYQTGVPHAMWRRGVETESAESVALHAAVYEVVLRSEEVGILPFLRAAGRGGRPGFFSSGKNAWLLYEALVEATAERLGQGEVDPESQPFSAEELATTFGRAIAAAGNERFLDFGQQGRGAILVCCREVDPTTGEMDGEKLLALGFFAHRTGAFLRVVVHERASLVQVRRQLAWDLSSFPEAFDPEADLDYETALARMVPLHLPEER